MKAAALFLLTLAASCANGAEAATPLELIDRLGVQLRNAPRPARQTERPTADAERNVAGEISALIHATPGHASLTAADAQGRTPLMQAVSGGYVRVVQALLTDASVRRSINQADANGETARMKAQFAPALTLPACQPGMLTLERYPLLTPYLQRMDLLMSSRNSTVGSIAQALDEAGAEPDADAARRAWLARCPNTDAELRDALARGDLMATLVNGALERLMRFNKAYATGLASIPQHPPAQMRFTAPGVSPASVTSLTCERMPRPVLAGALNWTGHLRLHVVATTRAGIVEAADIQLGADDTTPPYVVDHFRGVLLRTLAGYQCEDPMTPNATPPRGSPRWCAPRPATCR